MDTMSNKFSDITLRVISAVSDNKKASGVLISKIPEADKCLLRAMYDVEDYLDGLYCYAKKTKPAICKNCDNRTKLFRLSKGFKKFCSVVCANRSNNKLYNTQKNKSRSDNTKISNAPILELCVSEYINSNNIQTIKEIAETYDISPSTLSKHLSENNIKSSVDIKSVLHNIKMKKDFPQLFEQTFFLEHQESKKSSKVVAKELGISPNTICVYARNAGAPFPNELGSSSGEFEVGQIFNSYDIIKNSRSLISPYEIDIFLPKYNIGIEYNGAYWHSEVNGKDKQYHIRKQILAEENNIKLIQIFDFEWKTKSLQIEGYLKSLINENVRIYARNTEIRYPSKFETKEFFDTNHIHGNIGFKFSYGIYHNNELVSVLSIGKSRFTKKYDYEVLRFCNKIGITVVGGLSKLISHIKKTLEFNTIVSYTHRRLFDGNSFIKAGFELSHKTEPGYFWANQYTEEVLSRHKTQKHKLNTTMTESEYMKSKHFVKIWDCGQLVFCLYK